MASKSGWLMTLLVCAPAVASIPACLGDLPQAVQCPSPAAKEGKVLDCFEAVSQDFDAGVWVPDPNNLCIHEDKYNACYRGPSGCDCQRSDCLDDGDSDACFPSGDCPPRVTELFPDAKCIQLAADDIGPNQQEADQCLCGCESCMVVCDGRGPVWSQLEYYANGEPMDAKGTLFFDVRRYMPPSGKLGLYIRARGVATDIRTQAQMDADEPVSAPFVSIFPSESVTVRPFDALPLELDDRFEEVVLPRTQEADSWELDDDKPGFVVLGAGINTATTLEIDCVVPFLID